MALACDRIANSPAEQAGMQAGDVIITWNGEPITSQIDFMNRILPSDLGYRVQLGVQRGGENGDEIVQLDAIPGSDADAWFQNRGQADDNSRRAERKAKAAQRQREDAEKQRRKADDGAQKPADAAEVNPVDEEAVP